MTRSFKIHLNILTRSDTNSGHCFPRLDLLSKKKKNAQLQAHLKNILRMEDSQNSSSTCLSFLLSIPLSRIPIRNIISSYSRLRLRPNIQFRPTRRIPQTYTLQIIIVISVGCILECW